MPPPENARTHTQTDGQPEHIVPPVASVGWTEAVKREFRKENLVYTRDDRHRGN